MKKLSLFALFLLMNAVYAEPSPLVIPSWKNCTSSIIKGNKIFACLPESKPPNCPSASWQLLQSSMKPCIQK